MSDNEQHDLEGGEQKQQDQLAKAAHEGGAPPENVEAAVYASANSALRPEGVESALRTGNTAAPDAAPPILPGGGQGFTMSTFSFKSPFQAPTNPPRPSAMFLDSSSSLAFAPASLQAPPSGSSSATLVSEGNVELQVSKMSAKDLSQIVAGEIHGFNTESWIAEDASGAAIIGFVAPSVFSKFLEHELRISSKFHRARIQWILTELIVQDSSIDEARRESWRAFDASVMKHYAVPANVNSVTGDQLRPASSDLPVGRTLFNTPQAGGAARASSVASTPAFFSGRRLTNEQSANKAPPPFLKECGSPDDFQLEDSSLFAQTTRAAVSANASNIGQALGGGINITINQPSATPPKYVILTCASDSTEFYNWIRKNTKESLLALPVDRRNLSQLVSEDVKEEVARILRQLGASNSFYFDENCPYPKSWPDVTDHLLKKILFGINGPRSAADAKSRLKLRLCYLNDSTTAQDKMLSKMRKFFNDFKGTLKDFSYTWHMWDADDRLTHEMIVEALSDCFSNNEQIRGPDGVSMVPKSRNYAKIKEMIRERKSQTIEEIVHYIIDSFERVDMAVRSSKAIAYDIKPWKPDEKGKKRGVHQISGGSTEKAFKKPQQRPAAVHPRCNNCGRKSHACGERSCFWFGHPSGRGAQGVWTDGEPSLWLEKDDQKKWKVTRDSVFYGYAENQRTKKVGA
jgi:hypothetical protein